MIKEAAKRRITERLAEMVYGPKPGSATFKKWLGGAGALASAPSGAVLGALHGGTPAAAAAGALGTSALGGLQGVIPGAIIDAIRKGNYAARKAKVNRNIALGTGGVAAAGGTAAAIHAALKNKNRRD